MDTLVELVYEKADIDTRLALHQAFGVYKSIFYVPNFLVPRAKLEKALPAILAKREEHPDVTIINIHNGYKLVRHMNNIYYYEEVMGPLFADGDGRIVRQSKHPMYHWSMAFDKMLYTTNSSMIKTFFEEVYVYDERFHPFIEEKIEGHLDFYYDEIKRYIIGPQRMGLPDHLQGGYYGYELKRKIRHLEDLKAKFRDYNGAKP